MADRASLEDVLDVYLRHREVHPYGIADVAQFPDGASWWRDGDAVVGVVPVPGSPVPVVYAVAHDAATDAATLALLDQLTDVLPERFVVHGPRGLDRRLAGRFEARWVNDYEKLALVDADEVPPRDARVRVLTRADVAALEALYATDDHAGDFFHAGLVDTGSYVGIDDDGEDGQLVAAAGIHVIDRTHGVVALANVATRPDRRRQGLARAVVATLVRRLQREVHTIGLNVRDDNPGAARLYRSIGFAQVTTYAEAELVERA